MNTRQLLTTSALYGAAEVLVLAVSGFLLLPLYTRTLTQSEFGIYVVVKTNTEIFTYLLYLGLPSAVARVYFDYRKQGTHFEYLNSVLVMFAINVAACACVLAVAGDAIWKVLSPTTPAQPYLWYTFAIAAGGFVAALVSVWLRLEGRARTFVILQVAIAATLAAVATVSLVLLDAGLPGLLSALLVSGLLSAAVLPWLFGRRFRPILRLEHVTASLRYAVPILVGYIAYFALGRAGTLILQRHVALNEIAIFGLAQQLALLVTICATAFGKALQPAVFGAEPAQAHEIMRRAGRTFIAVVFCVASLVVLFCAEIVAVVAPRAYASSQIILLMLVAASLVYAFSLISDTALLYHRRPKTSAAVSVGGAVLAVVLGMWLIPRYHLLGAALATLGAFAGMTSVSHVIAYRVTRLSYAGSMLLAFAGVVAMAALSVWLSQLQLAFGLVIALKISIAALLCAAVFLFHNKESKGFMHPLIRAAAQGIGFNPLAWLGYTRRMREFSRDARVLPGQDRCTARFAVVVTPWIGSAVPWFSLACGLLLSANGNKVTFIVDDLPFGDKGARYRFVLRCIRSVFRVLRGRFEVVDLSAHRSHAALSAEARQSIHRLATLNAIWALRGEMVEAGRQRFTDICVGQLTAAHAAIAAVMPPGRFDVLFVPGGVYGTSGLWVERARAAGVRIASYDNGGYGALMLASDGLACQMHDIPRAFAMLKQSCVSEQERRFVIDAALAEIGRRRSGVDTFASQLRNTISVGERFDGAILLALNSSWDSAALGLHTVFENNMDWIVRTVRYLLEHTPATVVVRQHPAERLDYARTSDDYYALLQKHFGTHPRLIFIAAHEQINSYELLERVAAVVVYTSTIGTEAAASGKPVITPSNSYYSALGFVWRADDLSQYERLLADAAAGRLQVTAAMRDDALFCYYLTQCSQWVFSPFNPADFVKWSRYSLQGLYEDAKVRSVLKSLEENIPVAFLNHQESLRAATPELPA